MSIEAMKQALEALEWDADYDTSVTLQKAAMDVLRQAIEQAERMVPSDYPNSHQQEPVAFRNTETGDFCTGGFLRKDWAKWQPLYAAPARPVVHAVRCTYPQCQATNGCVGACSKGQAEKQEPVVGTKTWFEDGKMVTQHLYASDISQKPVDETAKDEHEFECPRCGHCCREWVGLTFTEYMEAIKGKEDIEDCWQAIEAKLKEKNR